MNYEIKFNVNANGFSVSVADENIGDLYYTRYEYGSNKGSRIVEEYGEIPDREVEERIDKILDLCNDMTNHLQIVASLNYTL